MSVLSRIFGPGEVRAIRSLERRDPSAATTMLNFQNLNTRVIPEWDPDTAIREAYLSSVTVYAAVQVLALCFAGCPLRAVLPGQLGAGQQRATNHDANAPLAKLLGPAPGGPNPTMSSRKLWANAIANLTVTGAIAWELEKPQGATGKDWQPVGIWPLIARSVQAIPTDGGSQLFSGFKYGRGAELKNLTPEQMFYSFTPSLNDIRQAASPLQAARYAITSDVLQSIYDVAFLRNDGRPAGIIVHEAFEEEQMTRSFRQQFAAEHRGPLNANRVAFAEVVGGNSGGAPNKGAIDWIQVGITQKDAQMLATKAAKAQDICISLGVPMGMLDASGRTFSNAGIEAQNFWLDRMLPLLSDMEDEINLKLAPRLGPHIAVFDTSHVKALEPPTKFMQGKIEDLVDRKIITPVEAREALGYPVQLEGEPIGGGSTLLEDSTILKNLVSTGYTPQEAAKIVGIAPPAAKEAPDPVPTPFPLVGVAAPTPAIAPPAAKPAIAKPTLVWMESLTSIRSALTREERRRESWRAADAQARAFEPAVKKAMQRLFAKQKSSTIKRLDARKGRWAKRDDGEDVNPDDVFDPAFWQDQTIEAITGVLEALYAAAGARAVPGLKFDINDPKVQAQIDYRASKLADQITGTTYDAIRSVILSGIQSGAGIPAIADGIEAVFASADGYRAELIARTETIAASADGALAAYGQAVDQGLLDPSTQGKEWIAEDDERTDEACLELDGEVVPFDETFSDGTDAPPQHPDCRCALAVADLSETRGVRPDDAAVLLRAISQGTLTTQHLEVA